MTAPTRSFTAIAHVGRESVTAAVRLWADLTRASFEVITTGRSELLDGRRVADFVFGVANQVLDEGVDVPEVKVAVVLGGTASTRQAKQRLGRVLRKVGNARATLYEVVCAATKEEQRSRRRRECDAYEGTRHRRL